MMTGLIGFVAAVNGTFIMAPQAIKSYQSKKVRDFSMGTAVLYVVNCILWFIYGVLRNDAPLILANGIGLLIGITLLVMKKLWG